VLPVVVIAWLSLVEFRLFERLLFARTDDVAFVLQAVHGVLDGHPVSQSWQHRFLGPLFVAAIEHLTRDPILALQIFYGLTLLAANLLLFFLTKRSLLAVCAFGFAHLLFAYKLEYPWDGIDVLIFLYFAFAAQKQNRFLSLWPLLLIGLFNHETILYLPLWYLLAPGQRRQSGIALLLMCAAIWFLRAHFYIGRPDIPGQEFEQSLPILDNHFHVLHNLETLATNFVSGRAHISLAVLAAIAILTHQLRAPETRRRALWSLLVILTIVCFGYTNETRHYLPLMACWTVWLWLSKSASSASA
jgi:hypothetical protein